MLRRPEDGAHRARLDDPPGVHDRHLLGRVGGDGEVVRDQHHRRAGVALRRLEERHHLRLDRRVEGGRRLVGDQDARPRRQRHGDHHPLAHAAGEAVRVVVDPRLRVGQVNAAQQRDRLAPCLGPGPRAVRADRLDDLPADRLHRIQRGDRILEDHRDAAVAQLAHAGLARLHQVLAFETDAAASEAHAGLGQDAHQRQRRQRLAAAGLADDRQRAARRQAKAHVVDQAHRHGAGAGFDDQVARP